MKKVLAVEYNMQKMRSINEVCKKLNIDIEWFFTINPDLIEYFREHQNEFSGIILELGLPIWDKHGKPHHNRLLGLELVEELTRKKIEIPILINSKTTIDLPEIMKNHKNVKGQTSCFAEDIQKHQKEIESFINTL